MELPLPTKTIDPERGYDHPGGGTGHVPAAAPGAGNKHLAKALQIASVLQTTLDLEEVIKLFSREIEGTVPHDSMTFEHPERGFKLTLGKPAKHSCSYRLVVSGTSVGQLTVTRKLKFTKDETFALEYLLCSLVYPLLNALKYKDAVESALKDPLTGLHNRLVMDEAVRRERKLAQRHKTPLSLIIMDIDDFKSINDRYGHATGDNVLQCVVRAIAGCVRDTDVLSRFGGEEFTVLLSNTDRIGALRLAERIRATVENEGCAADGEELRITISLGVACLAEGDDEEAFFERADRALYRAKAEGKNCVRFADVS